ncbi:MAG: aromatic ring-hydroxylating oxygenase subunit alpha [Endozoicomonas sp.]
MTALIKGRKPEKAEQLLPTYCYTKEQWFEREKKELFNRSWIYVCQASDLQKPGDFITVQVGEYPLVVIHGDDGELHGFHNLCRHRGAKILEGQGNISRAIVCPYHRWSYSRNGDLKAIPQGKDLFPEVNKCSLSLKRAALGEYRNLLFINPQESPAESFEDFLADIPANTWPGKTEELEPLVKMRWEIDCNWKVFVENAEDGYHLMHLHKDTLQGPKPEGQDWRAVGRHWIWDGKVPLFGKRLKTMSEEEKAKYADWQIVPGTDPKTYGGQVYKLFPTFILMPLLDIASITRLEPVSAQKTRMEVVVMAPRPRSAEEKQQQLEKLLAFAPMPGATVNEDGWVNDGKYLRMENFKDEHPLVSGNFHHEDVWQVQMMQQGMNSPAYEMGPMAPEVETALTYFQQNVLDFVPLKEEG